MLSQKVNQSFDTALDYVRLPRIQETPNKPQSGSENNAQNRGSPPQHVEQDPYAKIFGWLKTKKVEKIFKVIVDDLGDRTHSDEVIVEALKPFDVEVWDWRKFDMCSDTIQRAAPNVRHVFLHASGNNAVLRSWSCERGLAQLKNVSEKLSWSVLTSKLLTDSASLSFKPSRSRCIRGWVEDHSCRGLTKR